MSHIQNWAVAIAGTAAFLVAGALLDGPSEGDIAQAQAADLVDAQRHAELMADMTRICTEMRGPKAELLQIDGSNDYVCRTQEGK